MMDSKYFYEFSHEIRQESFYKAIHGHIFEAITEIYKKKQKPDPILIDNILKNNRSYIDAGGFDFLDITLDNFVPASSDISGYVEIINEKARARKLEQIATNIKDGS